MGELLNLGYVIAKHPIGESIKKGEEGTILEYNTNYDNYVFWFEGRQPFRFPYSEKWILENFEVFLEKNSNSI